jgi:SAM-dependent methyltransferase
MASLFTRRDTCRLCNSRDVVIAVPLAPIPVATPNIDVRAVASEQAGIERVSVPMNLYLCRNCGHLQILDVIDPTVQYVNFQYTTSISLGLPEHFRKLAGELIDSTGAKPGSLVIEIGSNDGTLLRAFKERGLEVLGIDPARETARRASANGIETIGDFFTSKLAAEIARKRRPATIVVANNTFANLDDLSDITSGITALLAPDGVFVFETSYGADVIEKFLLDTVYHEHLSYFMVRSLVDFFRRHGMELYDVQHIWTKGGSLRGFVRLARGSREISPSVAQMVAHEHALQLDDMAPYQRFAARIEDTRNSLKRIIEEHRATNQKIAGYGASVGTVTLLQQFGLAGALDFIADDNPLTEAIQIEARRIPVLKSEALYERKPALVIILAWRYADAIAKRHTKFVASGGRFLVPLPELKYL